MISINDHTVDDFLKAILNGDRAFIGRAITLVESRNLDHQEKAQALLHTLLPYAGKAQRVGISGVPGVGKSTFIESLGCWLTGEGNKVAVLAVDPSSSRTGGSILGDKTRMDKLSADNNAFIRPSPSSGVLGGVAKATRETIIILEAAGYNTILVETVGTGQSETMVADMVDFFLVLMLPGAGDELQGIKKGILELADMVAVNKADIFEKKLKQAMREYKSALHIMSDSTSTWHPPVVTCSGLTGDGVPELWERVIKHQKLMQASGERKIRRENQRVSWLNSYIRDQLLSDFFSSPTVKNAFSEINDQVKSGNIPVSRAANDLIDLYARKNVLKPD